MNKLDELRALKMALVDTLTALPWLLRGTCFMLAMGIVERLIDPPRDGALIMAIGVITAIGYLACVICFFRKLFAKAPKFGE